MLFQRLETCCCLSIAHSKALNHCSGCHCSVFLNPNLILASSSTFAKMCKRPLEYSLQPSSQWTACRRNRDFTCLCTYKQLIKCERAQDFDLSQRHSPVLSFKLHAEWRLTMVSPNLSILSSWYSCCCFGSISVSAAIKSHFLQCISQYSALIKL